jgi:hypothetical protein
LWLLLRPLLLPTLRRLLLLLLLLWLLLLLLWLLLRLLWLLLRLTLLLLAAAAEQLFYVPGCIHPCSADAQCCMQQLVSEHPQCPRQPLVADVAVRCHPRQVSLGGAWQAPDQWILGVIHCWFFLFFFSGYTSYNERSQATCRYPSKGPTREWHNLTSTTP